MAKGTVNKVVLVGNLGSDPEVRHTQAGNAVANASLATTESWKDKSTNEPVERTEWHRLVLFRRLAEVVGEYCRKGDKLFVEGKLQTRKWQDDGGNDRYSTEVVVDRLEMLGGKDRGSNVQADRQRPSAGGSPSAKIQAPPHGQADLDDDIPF